MGNLVVAKDLLTKDVTCVFVNDNRQFISTDTSLKSMLNFIKDEIDLKGYSVADKIVGKAVSMLFVYTGIKEVYGEVMSKTAFEYLKANGIVPLYKTLVENKTNKKGDAIDPLEEAIVGIEDCKKGYNIIKENLL